MSASPVFFVLVVTSGLTVAYMALDVAASPTSYALINQVGPAIILVCCAWASYRLLRDSPFGVWSPMTWFLAACAVYFGFGPLAYHWATPESIAYMDSFYPVDERLLFKTNLLDSVAIAGVCMGFVLAAVTTTKAIEAKFSVYDRVLVKRVMFVFLIVGGAVKYTLTLPYALGLLSWTLPGSVQHLSSLLSAAIIVLFVLIHHGDTKYRWILYPLIISELVSGAMTLSKLEVITTMLAVLLGRYLCRPNPRMLIGSLAVLFMVYAFILSPFVAFVRIAINVRGVEDPWMLLAAAAEFHYADRDSIPGHMPDVQGWWTRLAYANAQAFTMDAYDNGARGNTFGLLLNTPIPRWLFPDKPIMTSGAEFNALVKGSDQSNSGVGFFGEAYWNGGWILVFATCIGLGAVFTAFSRFSTRQIKAQQYLYLPVILIGVTMGLRPDDWFIPTVVGSSVQAVGMYLILKNVIKPGLQFNVRAPVRTVSSQSL